MRHWHLVRDVPKVLGFIGGTPEKPAPITDKEAMQILRRVEEGVDKPRPKVLRARRGGPRGRWTVNDFNGVVENVNYEKNGCRSPCRSSGARRPSNWTSRRWRRLRS